VCTLLSLGIGHVAHAQAEKHGIGLGAEQTIGGITGATFVYDTGKLHFHALAGFGKLDADRGPDASVFGLGGRVFFVVHSTPQSDFSIGGGLAFLAAEGTSLQGDDDETNLHVEAGGHLRVFLVPNIALGASLGLALILANEDDDLLSQSTFPFSSVAAEGGMVFGGQVLSTVGITYFFQ
jgi:hypothetical protein